MATDVREITHIAVVQVEGLVGDRATASKSFDSYELAEDWTRQVLCEEGGDDGSGVTVVKGAFADEEDLRNEISHLTIPESPVHGYIIAVR